MYRMYVKDDGKGNYVVTNADGAGIEGQSLGQKVEDLPGGAFMIQSESGDAHMACHMSDNRIMVIINNSEIESKN